MEKGITLLFIFFVLMLQSVIAQNDHQIMYFSQCSTVFKEHKAALTDNEKVAIDTICQRIIAAGVDSFFSKREIVLQSYTTTKERKKNNMIGMMRCVVILDYIESKHKMPRSKFLIRDRVPNPNSKPEVIFAFFRKLQ